MIVYMLFLIVAYYCVSCDIFNIIVYRCTHRVFYCVGGVKP
jgi:hypothetical protein